jgi:hypothetical protein
MVGENPLFPVIVSGQGADDAEAPYTKEGVVVWNPFD